MRLLEAEFNYKITLKKGTVQKFQRLSAKYGHKEVISKLDSMYERLLPNTKLPRNRDDRAKAVFGALRASTTA